jgi:protein-tyrosine phosphatase
MKTNGNRCSEVGAYAILRGKLASTAFDHRAPLEGNFLKSVLFICSGNIFRSLSAENTLRLSLGDSRSMLVGSAGTIAEPKEVPPLVHRILAELGADVGNHVPRRLTAEMLTNASHPVAIGIDHQDFVKDQFGVSIPFFNELAYGEMSSVPDLWEVYPDWRERPAHMIEIYTRSTINHIFECIPRILMKLGHPVPPVSG